MTEEEKDMSALGKFNRENTKRLRQRPHKSRRKAEDREKPSSSVSEEVGTRE